MLVTGGSGYLGSALLERAAEAVGTYLTTPIGGGVALDVRDADAVAHAVAGHDVVIHTAYVQERDDVIVAGTRTVARACAAAGARLVHISTDVVFDGALGRPYAEDDEPVPITDYGRAKLAAEREALAASPEAAIVRTSLIYGGPRLAPNQQERQVLDGKTAFFTDEVRSPVQVDDLAEAVLRIAESSDTGVFHLGGADAVSRFDFARLVVAARGGDPATVRSASFRQLGLDRPADCRLGSNRLPPLRGVREVLGG